MNPTPTVAYLRVSTLEQAREGVSLSAQRERIAAYCALRNLTLIRIIEDSGVSASIPIAQRPGGAQLVSILKSGKVNSVVAIKLDRLFRNAADCLATVNEWDKSGIALHIIDLGGNAVDTRSAAGRFMLTVMAGAAEMERNLTVERTKSALAHKKAHNQAYSPTPFGFNRVGKNLIPNQSETETLQHIRSLRNSGLSLRSICSQLSSVPTKLGGSWKPATVAKMLART